MRTFGVLVAGMVGLSTAARADDLRIQCPAGTVAVLESETTVVCRRKEAPAAAPAPSTETPSTGLELAGLHGVPEACGLRGVVENDVAERALEALSYAVGACVDETFAAPPTRPARWLPVVVAPEGKVYRAQVPDEPWAAELRACLGRRKVNAPRTLKGRSFTAYYLLVAPGDAMPARPACVDGAR